VKLVDANILIYAVNADAPRHEAARQWLEASLSAAEPVGFAWSVLLAFLRLTTRPGIFRSPLTVQEAFDVVDSWLAQAAAFIVEPGGRHGALLRSLLAETGSGGNLTSDAHLAALAIEHGALLCSCDADFRRFSGVRWVDALQ